MQRCCNTPSFAMIAHEASTQRAKGRECPLPSIPTSTRPARCRRAGDQAEAESSSIRCEIVPSFVSCGGCVPGGGEKPSKKGKFGGATTLKNNPGAVCGGNSFSSR